MSETIHIVEDDLTLNVMLKLCRYFHPDSGAWKNLLV